MGSILHFAKDTLQAFIGGLPKTVGGDKQASATYVPVTYSEQDLLNAYRASWLARKVVNIPAFDAFRKWRAWQAQEAQIEAIETEEKRLNLRATLIDAKVKARLYGGAAIYISDGSQDLKSPLEAGRIGKQGIVSLSVMAAGRLSAADVDDDPRSPTFGQVPFYTLTSQTGADVDIHASRFVVFNGDFFSGDMGASSGQIGGDSILQSSLGSIRQADAAAANISALLYEARIDIVRIPDLMGSLMTTDGKTRLLERFALANQAKGINATLILDKEEEYEQKTSSFAHLPETLHAFMQQVSGGADIPMTRLFGQSPGGLNATGDSDIRNYYDRIQALQTIEIEPAIRFLDEMLIRSALGSRPPEVHYIWNSLWQVSDKERAEIGKLDAEVIEKLNATGLFPSEALANAATNMLVEHSIMPGLQEDIDTAGGLPDYDLGDPANDKVPMLKAANDKADDPLPAE